MKKRYVPIWAKPKTELITTIAFGSGLLIAIVVEIIMQNVLSAMVLILFAGSFLFVLNLFLDDTWRCQKKYMLNEDCIISYVPFKKPHLIYLDQIYELFIVKYNNLRTNLSVSHVAVKDVYNKDRIIFDVILIKEGNPSWWHIKTNVFSQTIISECKEHVLFDFCYDSDTVLHILEKTKAMVYTDQEMYSIMKNDPNFKGYVDRIIQTNLDKPN